MMVWVDELRFERIDGSWGVGEMGWMDFGRDRWLGGRISRTGRT